MLPVISILVVVMNYERRRSQALIASITAFKGQVQGSELDTYSSKYIASDLTTSMEILDVSM